MGRLGPSTRDAVNHLILVVASLGLSALIAKFLLRSIDLNPENSKAALKRRREIQRRLGKAIVTNQYEDQILADVVRPEDIDVTLDSIGGLSDVKEKLRNIVILPLERPDLFRGKFSTPTRGVLLHGPPGTGKTLLAKALAKESGAAFVNVRVSYLMSKWFGDGAKLVNALFTLAEKLKPSIIFVDEAESFLGRREDRDHEASSTMKTEFLQMWDGFGTNQTSRVLVLCATNRPEALDEAVLRRLPSQYKIPMPNMEGRKSILKVLFQPDRTTGEGGLEMEDAEIEEIAEAAKGLSGSDLKEVCSQAQMRAVVDLLKGEKEREGRREEWRAYDEGLSVQDELRALTKDDFLEVLREFKPTNHLAYEFDGESAEGEEGEEAGERQRVGRVGPGIDLESLAGALLQNGFLKYHAQNGANGVNGANGANGANGTNGTNGASGANGENGFGHRGGNVGDGNSSHS